MIEKFERSGIAFQYPANWNIDDEVDGEDWVVTLQPPGSALLVVTYQEDGLEPSEMADETLEGGMDTKGRCPEGTRPSMMATTWERVSEMAKAA